MAGGKKNPKFSANPFRTLKGLRVSAPVEPKPPPTISPDRPSEDEDALFAREMQRLGLAGPETGEKTAGNGSPDRTGPEAAQDEESLFLAAIGRMESVFVDEFPEPVSPTASPRLRKLLKSGKLLPEAELDLHGLDRLRAREKVAHFLENCVYQGKKGVLLITGRGHGSAGEPVLRKEVEAFLTREARIWVQEWDRAPRRFGGDGALFVLLRGKKKM